MNPISHPLLDIFLHGVIAASSLIAGLFFLRFWRETRDSLFLAFLIFFVIQGSTTMYVVSMHHPNVGNPWMYGLRLFSVLVVLAAVLKKNFSAG
jgi:uncharacterized membrane protein HdeD (DUF308 family)